MRTNHVRDRMNEILCESADELVSSMPLDEIELRLVRLRRPACQNAPFACIWSEVVRRELPGFVPPDIEMAVSAFSKALRKRATWLRAAKLGRRTA